MQGGYEKYPVRPSPAPAEVGASLMQDDEDDLANPMGAESEMLAPVETAPVPSITNQLNSGYLSQSGPSSGLLAAIGGALERVESGIAQPTDPGRAATAEVRYVQLLRTGMSDEEARLMMQTGGA